MAYLEDIPKYAFGTSYELLYTDAGLQGASVRPPAPADTGPKSPKSHRRTHKSSESAKLSQSDGRHSTRNITTTGGGNSGTSQTGDKSCSSTSSTSSTSTKHGRAGPSTSTGGPANATGNSPSTSGEAHSVEQQSQQPDAEAKEGAPVFYVRKHPSSGLPMTELKLKEFILDAIRLGVRHFDCAPLYGTQHVVGAALQEAMDMQLSGSGARDRVECSDMSDCTQRVSNSSLNIPLIPVPRQQFFITSKLPPNMMRPENILRSIMSTLQELQLTYLDLFLIHAPFSTRHVADDVPYPLDAEGNVMLDNDDESLLDKAWLKMVDLKRKGLTRYIGLSNVNLEQLIRLNKLHQVDVVQNEYHMYNQDREIFDYCEEIDVHYEAYAAFGNPLRSHLYKRPCFVNDATVNRVARMNRLSVAQVNIQWIHQQPLSYVIKVDNLRQLQENLVASHYKTVSINDMIDLDSLNRNIRIYLFDEHKGIHRHREYPFKRTVRIEVPRREPMPLFRPDQLHPMEHRISSGVLQLPPLARTSSTSSTSSVSSAASLSSLSSSSTTTCTTIARKPELSDNPAHFGQASTGTLATKTTTTTTTIATSGSRTMISSSSSCDPLTSLPAESSKQPSTLATTNLPQSASSNDINHIQTSVSTSDIKQPTGSAISLNSDHLNAGWPFNVSNLKAQSAATLSSSSSSSLSYHSPQPLPPQSDYNESSA